MLVVVDCVSQIKVDESRSVSLLSLVERFWYQCNAARASSVKIAKIRIVITTVNTGERVARASV